MIMAAVTFVSSSAAKDPYWRNSRNDLLRRSPRMPQSRVPGGKSHRVGLGHHQWVSEHVMNGKHPTLGYVMRPRAIVGCGVLGAVPSVDEQHCDLCDHTVATSGGAPTTASVSSSSASIALASEMATYPSC